MFNAKTKNPLSIIMRPKLSLSIIAFFLISVSYLKAQNLAGDYNVSGYFFHPSAPRAIGSVKTITQVSANTYQVNILGDLPGFGFQFTVDGSNHLINWVATGSTAPAPASGFMTADNPGGFTYPGPPYPGTDPWLQTTYNNTYNPATHTFYMHYGYNTVATNQNGYDRQIYEQYVLIRSPKITSVTPLNATSLTRVVIRGENFSDVDPAAYSISFGNTLADSATVVSDTKIIAWIGSGASGNVRVNNTSGRYDTLPGFTYTPVTPVTNSQWSYVGKAGFSKGRVHNVSAASGSDNVPYIAFIDSAFKVQVMKPNNTKWVTVGGDVCDGGALFETIALTNTNVPVVGYIDSVNDKNITVKEYSGGNWITLGIPGFAPAYGAFQNPFSMALDTSGIPYVLSFASNNPYTISVFKLSGSNWVRVGGSNFATAGNGQANIAIDKNTNTPYIIFDDANTVNFSFGYQATVMKFNGKRWMTVGNAGFTAGRNGIFYPDIKIDGAGIPIVSMQEDDGFERLSAYQYKVGTWQPVGYQHFSKSRSYYNNLAIDKTNTPYVLFEDGSYNLQGTVMKFGKHKSKWDTTGRRGFIPYADYLERNSLFFDVNNTPMVAFSDKTKGGKLSVMKLDSASLLTKIDQQSDDDVLAKNNTGFAVFPNPAHSGVNINFTATGASTTLQIINEKGQPVIQKQIASSKGSNNIYIDISSLPAGIYIVSLKANNTVSSKQFVKE